LTAPEARNLFFGNGFHERPFGARSTIQAVEDLKLEAKNKTYQLLSEVGQGRSSAQ
jgi:hypothetical protein